MRSAPGSRLYVAGHRGLVGSALVRRLHASGRHDLLLRTRAELDLEDGPAVRAFFERERPGQVILAAAMVGGILANNTWPGQFIHRNLVIQSNVIGAAREFGTGRLLFLGSSCIYPRDCPQPIREDYLLTGPLEATNRPYAIAKIAGIETCWAFNREYGTRYLCVMPTNLYGPGDNYDLQSSHVLPALIRKMHEAKLRGDTEVVVWGTGTPRREFLYSDDMADACLLLLGLPDERFDALLAEYQPPLVNVGCGEDVTIRQLAEIVAKLVGFPGRLTFDAGKPDGTPRKLLDVNRMFGLGWRPTVGLEEGIGRAFSAYLAGPREPVLV